MRKSSKKKSNNKKLKKIILMLLIIILFIITLINMYIGQPKYEETYKTIYIGEDETLWTIAEDYKKPNQDIREYIFEIKKLNNMETATIYEGQELTIIIYKEIK